MITSDTIHILSIQAGAYSEPPKPTLNGNLNLLQAHPLTDMENENSRIISVPAWQVVVLSSLAGGLGWGIRGQYGHETGAMIAGLLVGLVLVLLLFPFGSNLQAARAVALCAASIGFGGAMTYGQTVGLTHNPEVVGHWTALGWGMLGLGIKGSLWIGFAGAFLGMGLSGVKYDLREMALILGGLLLLMLLGIGVFNLPYDPTHRILPRTYFSADWSWYPMAGDELKPRREIWGGFLAALTGLVVYLSWIRKDRLARNMALWGCLGGLGFPIGQSLQAFHAWNRDFFQTGFLGRIDPVINWWNFMETTFGLVMGAALGLGLWMNRRLIISVNGSRDLVMAPPAEFGLLAIHLLLLFLWEFASIRSLDAIGNLGISRSLIPLIAIAGGRYWPFFMALPVVAFPILGKTGITLGYPPSTYVGAGLFLLVPVILLTWLALHLGRATAAQPSTEAHRYLSLALVITTWLYFGLNFAVFNFPWPWQTWTVRTPNTVAYTLCALSLTWAALKFGRSQGPTSSCGN